jgi:hypothetical protein
MSRPRSTSSTADLDRAWDGKLLRGHLGRQFCDDPSHSRQLISFRLPLTASCALSLMCFSCRPWYIGLMSWKAVDQKCSPDHSWATLGGD